MAAAEKNDKSELDQLALELFQKRVAANMVPVGKGQAVTVACYRLAQEFLDAQKKIKAGEIKVEKPKGPQLANCHAPNLPRLHPHNLVSDKFGDLRRVTNVAKWLNTNTLPEEPREHEIDVFMQKFEREFPDLGWSVHEINIARRIFPHYVPAAA